MLTPGLGENVGGLGGSAISRILLVPVFHQAVLAVEKLHTIGIEEQITFRICYAGHKLPCCYTIISIYFFFRGAGIKVQVSSRTNVPVIRFFLGQGRKKYPSHGKGKKKQP